MKKIVFGLMLSLGFLIPAHAVKEVLFAPDDRPKTRLLEYIAAAKKRIHVAMYTFTEKDFADALVLASQRGVHVQVILDLSSVLSPYAKVYLLSPMVEVFAFVTKQHYSSDPQARTFAPLMHNKFAVIDDVVWTGSFNWTQSANSRNQENVVVIKDAQAVKKYEERFQIIREKCSKVEAVLQSMHVRNKKSITTKRVQKARRLLKRYHKNTCKSA
ncbi:MAG: Phospholipase D/Transphosphatidylase [candidate division TM6 bacterium GW2011_GWF2_38_10]|nr:MAG: Phospholipase D/Transphosphatidylase [candidate division TM6 bacterium GW2011_GWF2_38_10]